MQSKFLVALLAVVVALSLAGGCGGGGQGDGEQQGDGGQGGQGQGGGTDGNKKETTRGIIGEVNLEESTLVVEPEGEEPVTLTFDPEKIKVKLGREEAQLEDLQTGQRARVRYVTKDDEKMARAVIIQTGEETTG